MYSTLNNIIYEAPCTSLSGGVGKYLRYPDSTKNRNIEGGLRLTGRYKGRGEPTPLVSVVTTVFNSEFVVEKAICSVLMQTYDNLEYILVDGASTDGTLDVIKKYDDIIDYFISEPDGGLYEGMNKGLELAQGDYIIILNSDDWYVPDCIQKLVDTATANNLDLVCALAAETDVMGNFIRKIPMMPFGDNVRLRMPLRHETMLISKALYNKVGLYDQSYKIISDLKLTQNMYDVMNGFKQLDEIVMFFRKMGIASKLSTELLNERKRLINEQFNFLDGNEAELLANEYTKDIKPYIRLAEKYVDQKKFIGGVKGFLILHGAFRDREASKHLSIFSA